MNWNNAVETHKDDKVNSTLDHVGEFAPVKIEVRMLCKINMSITRDEKRCDKLNNFVSTLK